ncbi:MULTISPECIES: hypothetical protein [Rhizobium/Agrobacterium group]|uniref:Uncharacterized protein n=1 Tax=Rhizobium rhizogenes TaxID=359 RepID=A0A546XPK6_RHIRH|nr:MULTISPECIES: hypothetical protein [Rhizobium/Agrobacterium group]TRB02683.1 hypothetical protein EXN68_03150 [Rhizobium rhizogenes]
MVSSVDLSTRLTATRLALKAIKEQDDNSTATSSSSSRAALLGAYGVDTSSSTNTRLTQLLAQYAQTAGVETQTETTPQASSGDITQAGFMKDLKAMLEDLSKDPDKASQAKAMLEALAAGTLTVSDPSEGAQIKAWDVKADSKTTSKPATEIATTGWSDFLKDHLKRDGSAYSKSASGAYVDRISGDNAFFGSVGSRYYYLTWPQAKPGTLTV